MNRFALLAVVLVGCSVDDGGNTTCMSGSTDVCTGDTVCMGDACAAAFPHDYMITNLSATAPNQKSNGTPWNPNNADGSPSMSVDISVGGTVVKTTPVTTDSYNATYAGPFTVSLTSGTALDVKSSNTSGGALELVYDCPIPTVSAAIMRVRYVLCSGSGVTINYTIDPT